MISPNRLQPLLLLPWAALWLLGGIWLARAAFRLRSNEQVLVGVALGWLVQNWLANLLGPSLPLPVAFWLAAAFVFVTGLGLGLRMGWKNLLRLPIFPGQLLVLVGITYVYYSLSRGMAIFDDFQHLATISNIAAGDFPPHFVLDPNVLFGYHHFLQLFAAQLMRIGGLAPWIVVDAARALSVGLAVMLAAVWARRVTQSALAGFLAAMLVAFGSGTRWLLLLFPARMVAWLGQSVHLIGSGAGSGVSLGEALTQAWAVEGAGPIPFPFAFANGIFPAGIVAGHTANGLAVFVNIFLLLLTFNRWRSGWGAVLSAILLSIYGLLGEAELATAALGWGIILLAYLLLQLRRGGRLRIQPALLAWLCVMGAGGLIGLLQGGAWTDILFKTLARLNGQPAEASYQTIGFALAWPPAIVSSHLGPLSLLDPAGLIVALLELGPVLLALPLLIAWGIKAFRQCRWYESALAATAVFALFFVFVQFTGSTGVRNTPRLYVFMPILAAVAVPLGWLWVQDRSANLKLAAAGLALVTVLGGLVMFGVQLVAIQRPVYSYFITSLDAQMARAHWNRLAPGTLVFDPTPYRAPTLFGRLTNSSYTWYAAKPEWEALVQAPDPYHLRAAGFSYAYLDNRYWDDLAVQYQPALSQGCVKVLDEVSDKQGNFRRLIDLRGCALSKGQP